METSTKQNIFSPQIKVKPLCVKLFGLSSSWLVLYWQRVLSLPILQKIQGHLVRLDIQTSLTAINELWNSKRYRVGVLLVVMGVLSKHVYQLFDPNALIQGWYFKNIYWFLWTIRLDLFLIFFSVGVMMFFPKKMKLRYIVLFGMFGAVQEIIHYAFYTTDFVTFHMPKTWTVKLLGFFVPVFILSIADYMAYRKYHIKHGSIARIFGIAKTPGLPAETKLEIINKEEEVIKNFYAKY